MDKIGVLTNMAKKKPGVGRPRESDPLRSLISLKGTQAFEEWLDGLVEHTHQGTRTHLLKNAIREYAERHGYTRPIPKR